MRVGDSSARRTACSVISEKEIRWTGTWSARTCQAINTIGPRAREQRGHIGPRAGGGPRVGGGPMAGGGPRAGGTYSLTYLLTERARRALLLTHLLTYLLTHLLTYRAGSESFVHVPRDRLSLAIGVGRQIERASGAHRCLESPQHGARPAHKLEIHRKVLFWAHLPPGGVASTAARRSSRVISGHLKSSRAISGHLGSSRAISGHPSKISGHLHLHFPAISGHLGPSRAISGCRHEPGTTDGPHICIRSAARATYECIAQRRPHHACIAQPGP